MDLSKRFVIIVGSILGGWLLSWLVILNPASAQIQTSRTNVASYVIQLQDLYQSDYAPHEKHLSSVQKQNRELHELLENLSKKIPFPITKTSKSGGFISFRAECKNLHNLILAQCNKMGITLGKHLGQKPMGFSPQISTNNFHDGYWQALGVSNFVVSQVLKEHKTGNKIVAIKDIGYPKLDSPISEGLFFQKIPIKFQFISSMKSILSIIERFSQAEAEDYFLLVESVNFQKVDKAEKAGSVQAEIILSAIVSDLGGKTMVEDIPNVEALPIESNPEDTRPIWEQY